jgi:hypothetical protein
MRLVLVALLSCAALACAGTDGEAVAADSSCNPTSPAVDPVTMKPLFGTGAPGASCDKHTDCAALCCTCSAKPSEKFLASECVGNKCAAQATACADEEHLVGSYVCP